MLQRKQRVRVDTSNLADAKKTFNQGVCSIYQANERRLTNLVGKFNYSIETVGVTQFWEAKVNNVGIDMAIGVLYNNLIDNQCIVKIGDEFYKIVKMTYKDNSRPVYWNIALERSRFSYEDDTE